MAYRRRPKPAALSAFYLALVLGMSGYAGYVLVIRGKDLLQRWTLREHLTMVAVIGVLWLLFWPLFAASRRRGERSGRTTGTGT
ncbi:MAG: hypothetical protein WA890_00840 [Micromonospora sp.]